MKYGIAEIRAPKNRLGLPCFDYFCDLECVRKRSYVMLNGKLAHILCDLLKCKKRLGVEKTVKVTFCQRKKCKNLHSLPLVIPFALGSDVYRARAKVDLEHVQCGLAPKRSRVSFGKPSGTLRMHKGSDKGWHYREM